MKLTPEDIEKVRTKNLANIIRKANSEKPLTPGELRQLEEARRADGEVQASGKSSGYAPNLDELADAIGIDRRSITNAKTKFAKEYKARKKDLERADGRYPIAAWRQFIADCGIRGRGGDHLDDEKLIRVETMKLNLEERRFEFEKKKDRMLSASEVEFTTQALCGSLLSALNAFTGRVNPLLNGLDFHDRAKVLEDEIEIIRGTLYRGEHLPEPDPERE